MATIDIRYPHKTEFDDACARARRLLDGFAEERSELISSLEWDSERSGRAKGMGFKGRFDVTEQDVCIAIDLSLLVRPFKGKIETRLMQRLVAEFGE